jgi:quercetin dioxygenase-like cupin family protein
MSYYLDADKFMDWMLEVVMNDEQKPYVDEHIDDSTWIRTFDPKVTNSEEYVWHRDHKDRIVTVLEGQGWQFQFDEKLPEMINSTDMITIPKDTYHRLIVGKTKLRLKIEEVDL